MSNYQESKNRYLRESVDEIKLRVPKGYKDIIKREAQYYNKSVNSFILDLIRDKVNQRDGGNSSDYNR